MRKTILADILNIPEKVVPLHTECGEICLLATTLKNAKIFHIVFLVSLHVFRIRWSFLFSPAALKCDV